jgi:hypothetical protein
MREFQNIIKSSLGNPILIPIGKAVPADSTFMIKKSSVDAG